MMENNNASKLSSLSKEQLQLLLKKRAEKGLQDKNVLSKMPRNRENIYPLSSAQQRFWFLDQLDENHILYNNPIYGLLTFKEPLRTDLIERTIKEIIHRHDIFRTAFVCKNGVPYQKIEETVPFHLEFEDVRALPDEDKDTYVAESAKREATQQIPLDKAPLFRFRYIQLSDSKYLFLYTPHHIISDGWSNGQFLRELVMLYNSFRTSGINNLSLPEYQFIDYVAWEQQWMGSDSYKASVDYWKNTLLPLPENLKLPVDKKRPVMLSGKGKLITLPLSEKLTKEIHAYCQQENVTPFNFFLAALNVLLYRYSQQSEIIIGVPVANREEREFQEISGLFLNTLPYKTPIHSQQSFRNILLQIKEQSYNNLKRQKLPFDKLLSELKVERNLQSTPLFQVLFVFQNIPSLYSNANISIEPYKQDLGTTKYDLNFWIEEYNGKFVITLTANTELFSNGMIERILQHYSRLVQELLVAPLLPVSTVRFMTADEQSMSFGTKSVQQPDANVKDLIEAAVRCHPEEVALEFEDKQLTYNQLNCQANRLANLLIEKNVNKHPVVILLNRGMEMIVALTATIKSGVPSIPIDAKLPLERIKYIIEDSKANLVISHSQLNEKSRILSADIIVMDEQQAEIERYSDVNPAVKMTSDDLVYIIYTSGTTGASKGVCISHKSLVNYIRAIIDRLGFKSGKRYVTVSTLSADLGNTMIYPSLVNGGKLLITNDEEMISPDLLANRFRKTLPDYLKIVPSHLNALLNGGLDILPAKAIIFGGEVLNKQLVERIKRMSPTLEIYNHYGPTESTIGVTTYKVSGDEEEIPIGKPLNNTCVYLLDEEGAALPAGVEGEIYIGGESLANGYLNNPELTREKFITDPYYPDRKLFKTGDKGILDNEGNLLFRGRKDRQVKIRGNRVELREIEVCLEDLDIVSQAVVLTPSSKTKEQLWAVVQAKETADAEKIKALLIHALPGYMIPDRIFILNLIPVTSNGKTDYDKIHSLINEEKSRQNAAVQLESLTSDEQKIQAIFAKILGIECFGPDDSFFDLGGNSLSAIELLYHIKQTFQVNLPLAFLFHYSTIKKIAGELHKNNTFQPLVKMKEGCGDDVLVLVHPAGGDVFCYHTFSGQFVSDISIYGLQSRIVVSGDTNNAIKILADKYLSIIESQNIQGNLIFGGWSMGALIAFEMAVKYSAKKDLFPSVLIIDQTAYTHNVSTNSKDDMDRIVLFAEKVEHLIGEELGITREKIKDMSDWECSALFFEKFRHYGLVPESIEINDFHGFLELMIYHNEISLNYYPSDYKGKVIVVKSENPMMLRTGATLYSDERPRDLLWRTFAGEIHEITSPGNHVSMMRSPFVEVLVKRLEKILTP